MKAAVVTFDTLIIKQLLGLDLTDINVVDAQVDYGIWQRPVLRLVLAGEGLSNEFTVQEGDKISEGVIIIHTVHTQTEIRKV